MFNWLKNLKVKYKLAVGFSIILFLMLIIGVVGLKSVNKIHELVNNIFYQRIPSMDFLLEADRDLHQLLIAERSMIVTDPQSNDFNALLEAYQTNRDQALERFKKYENLSTTKQEKVLAEKFYQDYKAWQVISQRVVDNCMNGTEAGKQLALELSTHDAAVKFEIMRDNLDKLTEINLNLTDKDYKNSIEITKGASFGIILVIIISFVLAIGIITTITILINRPLFKITKTAHALSKGDIAQETNITQKDEIGDLANSFHELSNSLNEKTLAAKNIADGNLEFTLNIQSDRDILGNAMLQMTDRIKAMITSVDELAESAIHGELEKRANESQFSGDFQKIIKGINGTLDSVAAPVKQVLAVLEKLANKDLTPRMTGDYEGSFLKIKNALNMAVANLDDGMQQVAVASDQVASASDQIGTGSQAVAQGASEQASSLEEVSSNLQEMSAMTKQNASTAKEAKTTSERAREFAAQGSESMNNLSDAISQIKNSSDETAKIIKTIDEIAFQTNLLALNAAVEAARAGEAGKGFAVVAEEVRNLAMRSAEAAKDTASMIQEAVKNADNGVNLNVEVTKILNKTTENVNKVGEMMAEIATASEQQSEGIDQINTAVDQMNQVTQQNAANSEQSASAAQELSSQAEEMRSLVAVYQLSRENFSYNDKGPQYHNTVSHQERKPINLTKNGNSKDTDPEKIIPFSKGDSLTASSEDDILKHF